MGSRGHRSIAASLAGAIVVTAGFVASPADAQPNVSVLASQVADAHEPTISADGRWIVFSGLSGERRSVYRTDRDSGATAELSPVPAGVRSGDTVHPRISADGCVVTAITEVAYDLFRDDDRAERWDVYRLVLPECGGQPNGWELVSIDARTGASMDGVDVDSPPSMSSTGAVVAFAHPMAGGSDELMTISVVDVSIAPNEAGRLSAVAGTPAEAPNRAYVYRGARQPALSQNGRHLAFVADFTASDPLPGWAPGPVAGGEATAQVYVWDRFAADPRIAVRLVSARDGRPSAAGGEWPTISEDGRVIAFVSRDRFLVDATLPECAPLCASQIYRFDRDVDGNGIFDELPRTPPLTLVSATPTRFGLPVAGDRSSWSPAISFDGSQIAFVTDATNLLPTHRGGGGDGTDGDLLVAEHHLGEIRRVIDDPSLTGVPGAHGRPAMSRTGAVIVFDTVAGGPLRGVRRMTTGSGRAIATVDVTPRLSLASLDFGTTLVGFESTELYATVRNAGPGGFEPAATTVTSAFRITGGTCQPGVVVAAGQSCSVKLVFRPTGPRGYSGTLTVSGNGPDGVSVEAEVRGAAGEPTLLADPGGVDLPASTVGQVGGRVAIGITNTGFLPTRVARLELGGASPDDFVIVEESCTGRALNPDAVCAVEIEFVPQGVGYRSALLVATAGGGSAATNGAYTSAVLGGYASYAPTVELAAEGGPDGDPGTARPGELIGLGGRGFPGEADVTIGFDDGSAPFATVTSSPEGAVLAEVRIPGRTRTGPRRLVVTSTDGAVTTVPLEIVGRRAHAVPGLPGYGLGS